MIQTEIRNPRGEVEKLDHNDPRYWEGPYVYQPYPKALYRQAQPGAPVESREVANAHEHERLGGGWFESPADAKAHFEQIEADMAKAAAEHNYEASRMSAKAQAEQLAHARSTDEMTADVPAPKKRPGRPAKTEDPS